LKSALPAAMVNELAALTEIRDRVRIDPTSWQRIGDPNALFESGTLLERGEILPLQG
jgi:hypothetical protein